MVLQVQVIILSPYVKISFRFGRCILLKTNSITMTGIQATIYIRIGITIWSSHRIDSEHIRKVVENIIKEVGIDTFTN